MRLHHGALSSRLCLCVWICLSLLPASPPLRLSASPPLRLSASPPLRLSASLPRCLAASLPRCHSSCGVARFPLPHGRSRTKRASSVAPGAAAQRLSAAPSSLQTQLSLTLSRSCSLTRLSPMWQGNGPRIIWSMVNGDRSREVRRVAPEAGGEGGRAVRASPRRRGRGVQLTKESRERSRLLPPAGRDHCTPRCRWYIWIHLHALCEDYCSEL